MSGPPFEIANGDPTLPFYWLTDDALKYVMHAMDDSDEARIAASAVHDATHINGDTCYDCDSGVLEPSIQASSETIVKMCAELDRRGKPANDFTLQRALLRLAAGASQPNPGGIVFKVVKEMEGVPLEPLPVAK
jgi:hypothetical protein